MDAASQLVYCGIDPLRRWSPSQLSVSRNKVRFRRRLGRVTAASAEPRPTRTAAPAASTVNGSSRSSPPKSVNGVSTKIGDVSQEIKRVRAQMEENEQLATLMRGLRGQNLRDSLFAEDNVQLRLVEVDESSEFLPLVYDPASISAYWGKRPRAVATCIVQLLSVAGGFLSRLLWDAINKNVKANEVAWAIELQEIVTSLGPAYIKLGQALSIRPGILSPATMTELQKLCDKIDDLDFLKQIGVDPEKVYLNKNNSELAKLRFHVLCGGYLSL